MTRTRPLLALIAASALLAEPALAQTVEQDAAQPEAVEQLVGQDADQPADDQQVGAQEQEASGTEAIEGDQLADASAATQPQVDAKTCQRNAALKGVLGLLLGEQELGDALKAQVDAC